MASIIEFNLLAPYNEKAALTGSFSDWQDVAMQKGKDGYFRTSIKLADGQYQYKFRVQTKPESQQAGAWVTINDPYVTAIDRHTGNGVVWLKDGQRIVDPYVWQHDEQPLPQNHELVIYELLVSDFYQAENGNRRGQFRDVIKKLDYLQDLGINAIELLPINESPGDYNWGYIPSYFFAPQANYGTTAELKQLIDECHARGIRVFLDQIYNHSSEDSPLLHIDRNYWYYPDRHHPDAPPSDYWGPEFNYEHYDENLDLQPARAFMGDVMKFWICEYHIDGIRFDALKQIDNRDFLQWMTQLAQATTAAKPLFTIGEHIPEDPGLVRPNGPMDSCWHENFYYQVVPHLQDEKFDLEALKAALNPSQQGYPNGVTKAVIYLCNHDRQRLMLTLGEHEILDEMAFERSRLGAVLLMTAVGIPLIWMGEEFGSSTAISMDNHEQTLDWSLLKNKRNQALFDFYKSLILLRKQNPALQTANITFLHEHAEAEVLAYMRWNEQGARVVVVVNFSAEPLMHYAIPNMPENGTWHEWTRDYDTNVENYQLQVDLGGYEAHVFVWQ